MTTLHVEDMTCGGCVTAITKALRAVDKDAAVDADLATRQVSVRSSAAAGILAAAVRQAGFTVSEA